MEQQLFPDEIIENSAEQNFHTHSVRTKIIYNSAALFTAAVLAVLPFIYVDVSVLSHGVIQPLTERNQLKSLVSGNIGKLYIRENKPVTKGQMIAEITAPLLQEKLSFNRRRQEEISRYLADLKILSRVDTGSAYTTSDLITANYQFALTQFNEEMRNANREIDKAERIFSRENHLYGRELISKAAYERSAFALETARSDLALLVEQQKNEWKSEQTGYREELEQLQTEENRIIREMQQYVIRAPVSGTIQNMQGLYEGSTVYPNQTIAEISPDTGLVAECYVPPNDIGFIHEGMETRLQISAFDYNQWGILQGTVIEISDDVRLINKRPVFIVRSSLSRRYLELENGYRGYLKKGMTLQARYTITRRSLFQLLYDTVDDWLNPQWNDLAYQPGPVSAPRATDE